MAKLIVVYWREIPSQVVVKGRQESYKLKLSRRFQEAIQRAAMRAGKGSSDFYITDWRRVSRHCGPDLRVEAEEAVESFERQYSDEDLMVLVRGNGLAIRDIDG